MTAGMDVSLAIAASRLSEAGPRGIYKIFLMAECTASLVIMNAGANNGCFSGRGISLRITSGPWTIILAIVLGTVFGQTIRGRNGM